MSKKQRLREASMHIKSHTVGTSNEISFSVLDAAKESQIKAQQEVSSVGGVDVFTLPGRRVKPKGAPKKNESLIYQSEAVTKKSKHAKQTWTSKASSFGTKSSTGIIGVEAKNHPGIMRVVVLVGILILLVIGIFFGSSLFQDEASKQRHYRAELNTAIETVRETDQAFDALQILVDDLLGSYPTEEALIAEQRAHVNSLLASVDTQAREASKNLKNRDDQQAAGNVVASISSRSSLWNIGLALIDESAAMKAAKLSLEEGWQLALDGDGALKDAANEILSATTLAIETAQTSTQEAKNYFSQALTNFKEVQNIYPAFDVTAYVVYTEKRLEACDYAIASNQALLDHDIEFAQEQNEAYNKADSEAVLLADDLPRNPTEELNDVFVANTDQNRKRFETTRAQTENTDAFIRDYLGAEKK